MDDETQVVLFIFCLVFGLLVGMCVTWERVDHQRHGCQGMEGKYDEGNYIIDPVSEADSPQVVYVVDTGLGPGNQQYWYKCDNGTYIVPDQPNYDRIPDRVKENQNNATVANVV